MISYVCETRHEAQNFKIDNLNAVINSIFPLIQVEALRTGQNVSFEPNDIPDTVFDKKEI